MLLTAFHILLSFATLSVHLYFIFNLECIAPDMAFALLHYGGAYAGKAHFSIVVILLLPFASICCFLFPKWLMIRFSPRTRLLGEPILTEGCWYLFGYLLILITIAGIMCFI